MRYRAVLVTVLVGAALVACGGRQEAAPASPGGGGSCEVTRDTRISIATGNTGGVYYVLGGRFGEVVTQATDGKLKATAAETGASVQNIQQLAAGTHQVAFSLADSAADAVVGKGAFEGKPQRIAALGRIYPNYTQVVARSDAGINSVADLRGKRVSTGSPKSGTEVIANRVLASAGLNPERDVSAQRLDLGASVDGMKDGTVDALFFSGGLPTPNITDLFTSLRGKVKLLGTDGQLTEMRKINPVYQVATIPGATYPGAVDTPTIVVPNLLLVPTTMDPAVACVLTRTLYERTAELVAANPSARDITRQNARATDPVPLHPGAARALDALGAG
ncbi:TAXI family TRAP transporter solute-binding subunit [Pseudonocardia acaciae]|uniref:TAXI family TRAP transporter solute-binding subunit n=1 Tax=Pseudonocardia acaciae TaxID=551276 RepID=UPI00068500E5|nr:TAXI family TRAP transporter solute-binding subunit [Pseudonocardia acaciae]